MKNWTRGFVLLLVILSYGIVIAGEVPTLANEDQQTAISEIQKISSGDVIIKWDERRGVVKYISGQLSAPSERSKEELSIEFIKHYKVLFGVKDPEKEIELD